jgi:hypothetical protein|tara:strand:- start:121 stop:246 length:126 start_codon:yes stop_codon:yes gene_type:complete
MARFPLRVLGLLLLTATITVASCQAVFYGAELPAVLELTED